MLIENLKMLLGQRVKKSKLIKNSKMFLDILFIKFLKQVKKMIGSNYNDKKNKSFF
jgi:hypothetical protein